MRLARLRQVARQRGAERRASAGRARGRTGRPGPAARAARRGRRRSARRSRRRPVARRRSAASSTSARSAPRARRAPGRRPSASVGKARRAVPGQVGRDDAMRRRQLGDHAQPGARHMRPGPWSSSSGAPLAALEHGRRDAGQPTGAARSRAPRQQRCRATAPPRRARVVSRVSVAGRHGLLHSSARAPTMERASASASDERPNFALGSAWVIRPTWRSQTSPVLVGVGRRRRARGDADLGEDVAHVPVHRALAEHELGGDRLVARGRRRAGAAPRARGLSGLPLPALPRPSRSSRPGRRPALPRVARTRRGPPPAPAQPSPRLRVPGRPALRGRGHARRRTAPPAPATASTPAAARPARRGHRRRPARRAPRA